MCASSEPRYLLFLTWSRQSVRPYAVTSPTGGSPGALHGTSAVA